MFYIICPSTLQTMFSRRCIEENITTAVEAFGYVCVYFRMSHVFGNTRSKLLLFSTNNILALPQESLNLLNWLAGLSAWLVWLSMTCKQEVAGLSPAADTLFSSCQLLKHVRHTFICDFCWYFMLMCRGGKVCCHVKAALKKMPTKCKVCLKI